MNIDMKINGNIFTYTYEYMHSYSQALTTHYMARTRASTRYAAIGHLSLSKGRKNQFQW